MTYEQNMIARTEGYLMHFGVKGQKWGVRRYQNPDGTLTEAGKAHYSVDAGGNKKLEKKFNKESKKLEKWTERTDQLGQAKKALEYDKKAKNARRIGNAALAVALPAAGAAAATSNQQRMIDLQNDLTEAGNRESSSERILRERAKDSLNNFGNLYAHDTLNRSADRAGATMRLAYKLSDAVGSVRRNKVINPLSTGLAIGAGATAVGAYGKAAHDRIKANTAKKYASDKGHAKAVAKRQAQFNKMLNTFAGTPYADLLNKRK